jgi:hypothetical protein
MAGEVGLLNREPHLFAIVPDVDVFYDLTEGRNGFCFHRSNEY